MHIFSWAVSQTLEPNKVSWTQLYSIASIEFFDSMSGKYFKDIVKETLLSKDVSDREVAKKLEE
jgi:hypothetical protein